MTSGPEHASIDTEPSDGAKRRVIVNPTSGGGEHPPMVRRLAERHGYAVVETAGRGDCGAGRAFSSPRNAFENEALRRRLAAEGVDYAWVSTRIAPHGTS